MRLLVDGIFYQLARTGIARVWSSLLPRLAACPDIEITMLDRGGCPDILGIRRVEFPSYTWNNTAADSLLIDTFAKELNSDVFTSTYYTTPTTIPSVLMVYDMIPEVLGFDLSTRAWKEKEIAISFARYYACISANTRSDLIELYPSIAPERAIVTHCGLDVASFRPRSVDEVAAFRASFAISKPYFVLVGSREQHTGYKNAGLLFEALRTMKRQPLHVLCIGGEPEIQPHFLEGLPSGVTVQKLDLTDDQLSCAYAGAEALVYPSLYEGFGMPVIEAMACGCPVITTQLGSLGEVAGDAAVFISGRDKDELGEAMALVRHPAQRLEIVERGLRQANSFSWNPMAREFHRLLGQAIAESQTPRGQDFLRKWARLRSIQAEVDVGI